MDGPAALGTWPCPKLDTQARFVGLTSRQWCYVALAYALWRQGLPLVPAGWPQWVWAGLCALVGLLGVLVRWHGLDLWGVWGKALAHAGTPALSVWRPVDPAWEAVGADGLEDDDGDAAEADEAAAAPDNPLGWALPALATAA